MDALEPFDFHLYDLSTHGNANHDRSITLYFRPNEKEETPESAQTPILLFCVLLNPRSGKLEFLGSMVAESDSDLHSICFGNICKLHRELKDSECSFFRMLSAERVQQIFAFQKTLKAV